MGFGIYWPNPWFLILTSWQSCAKVWVPDWPDVKIKNHGLGQYGAEPHYSTLPFWQLCALKGIVTLSPRDWCAIVSFQAIWSLLNKHYFRITLSPYMTSCVRGVKHIWNIKMQFLSNVSLYLRSDTRNGYSCYDAWMGIIMLLPVSVITFKDNLKPV